MALDYPGGWGLWTGRRQGNDGRVGRGPVSTLVWGGAQGGGELERGAYISLCVSTVSLPGQARLFPSFLVVRFHSQNRWSVLSPVKQHL